ncbi:MAG: hypothetical protein IPM58_03030 [Nitrospira sp.]|nr:hypothetical protein [Nitrospira sp.]
MSYGCLGYVAYVYLSWFYLYLVNVRGFTVLSGGLFAAALSDDPVSCPAGGWVTDRLAIRHGITKGRQIVGMLGMGLAAGSIALGANMEFPYLAIASLSLRRLAVLHDRRLVVFHKRSLTDSRRQPVRFANMGLISGSAFSDLHTMDRATVGLDCFLSVAAAMALIGGIMWLGIHLVTASQKIGPGCDR